MSIVIPTAMIPITEACLTILKKLRHVKNAEVVKLKNKAIIVENKTQAKKLPKFKKLAAVIQTTQTHRYARVCSRIAMSDGPSLSLTSESGMLASS